MPDVPVARHDARRCARARLPAAAGLSAPLRSACARPRRRARAVAGEGLPSLRLNADYGAIGLHLGTSLPTFNVTGAWMCRSSRAAAQRTLARSGRRSAQRRAEAEDMRAEIYYDVRDGVSRSAGNRGAAAGGDPRPRTRRAAADAVARSLRRRRGQNIEVVQAQEAVALASEQYIDALYGFNVAKALLARRWDRRKSAVEKLSRRRRIDDAQTGSHRRSVVVIAMAVAAASGSGRPADRESTDDAQVDAHVTPIAARVGGTVMSVPVVDNQPVEAGTVLVEIDPRDYRDCRSNARAPSWPTPRPRPWRAQRQRADHLHHDDQQRVDGARRCGAGAGGRRRGASRPSRRPRRGSPRRRRGSARQEANATESARATSSGFKPAAREGRDRAAAVRRRRGGRGRGARRVDRRAAQVTEAEPAIRSPRAGWRRHASAQQASAGAARPRRRRPQQVAATQARAAAAEARSAGARPWSSRPSSIWNTPR